MGNSEMRKFFSGLTFFLLISVVFTFPEDVLHRNKRFIAQTKCYDELGCFSTGGDFYDPLIRPLQFLPQTREQIRVRYYLFTSKNPNDAQELKLHDTNLLFKSNFDGSKPTKIITHGFLENGLVPWINNMRKALLLAGDFNVIQFDWGGGSQLPYTQATANTRLVGAEVALMIKFLEQNAGANRKDFHFMGHSLGSHIAGYTGEKLDGKLGRITGLDPAGPYFENTKPSVRLDPSDALFVDAIHTDGNSILSVIKLEGGMGLMQPVGHVDFYPNGGKYQPNCSKNPIKNILINGIIEGTKWTVACDHLRVLPLFTDTILASSKCKFKAYQCDSYENFKNGKCNSCSNSGCAYMGYHAAEWTGSYNKATMFLDTAGEESFCLHEYFLTIKTGTGVNAKDVYGNMFVTFHGSKGSTKEIQFFEKATTLKKSTSYGRVFDHVANVGIVDRVTFKWVYSKSILDPGGLIFNRYLYVDNISLVNGEEQSTANFCARNNALTSESQVTLDVNDRC